MRKNAQRAKRFHYSQMATLYNVSFLKVSDAGTHKALLWIQNLIVISNFILCSVPILTCFLLKFTYNLSCYFKS